MSDLKNGICFENRRTAGVRAAKSLAASGSFGKSQGAFMPCDVFLFRAASEWAVHGEKTEKRNIL